MKLLHRIGYYLGGFSLGLILLAFFLSGKKTSCAYGPNARTIKNISIKEHIYSDETLLAMRNYSLDTLAVSQLLRTSSVNFSESDTKGDSCKVYLLENEIDDKDVQLWVKNCDSSATIQSITIKNAS